MAAVGSESLCGRAEEAAEGAEAAETRCGLDGEAEGRRGDAASSALGGSPLVAVEAAGAVASRDCACEEAVLKRRMVRSVTWLLVLWLS